VTCACRKLKIETYDGPDLHHCRDCGFFGRATLRTLVRQTLNRFMENIIVGLIALALFAYLFVAMVYPENF